MASQTETAEVTFHSLTLSNKRKFCYSQTGDTESNTVIIFFHGLFGIGNARGVLQNFYKQNKIHSLCPTLPGWGESEPIDDSQPIHIAFPKMIEELLLHLGKKSDTLRLYISGGSFGTVPAQILFGSPPTVFSFATCVKGMLLLAPFSPFKLHTDYKKGMSLPNWVSIGPLSFYLPFRILPRLLSSVFAKKLATPESAEEFIKTALFNKANREEKEAYDKYRERYGLPEGEVEKNMGENAAKSVEHSLEGFLMTTTWLHADWGFEPNKITHHNNINNDNNDNNDKNNGDNGDNKNKNKNKNNNEVKVLLTVSSGDTSAHEEMALWLEQNYKNASIWRIDGGHLAALYSIQEITEQFLQNELL